MSVVDQYNQLRRRHPVGAAVTRRRRLTEEVPTTSDAVLLHEAQPGKRRRDLTGLPFDVM